ncbi:MAG: PilZ domain-containing protein [Acidobacteria bacterium]|nr:PilZ domain-containing protein [Acidobacteriota bacterium]
MRAIARIQLAKPLVGKIGSRDAVIRDVSLTGLRVEHDFALKIGVETRVTFEWHESPIELSASVIRCKLETFASGLTVYQSGLRFTEATSPGAKRLRARITDELVHALEEQKANARGDIPRFLQRMVIFARGGHVTRNASDVAWEYESEIALPYYRIARERGYVRYSLSPAGWSRKRTHVSDQPDEGFTLWSHEDNEDVALLCTAYETGNRATRWTIRTCAELSLIVDDSIPPQRFMP